VFDYSSHTELNAVASKIPDRLNQRLVGLEADVLKPGGAFAKLQADLKAMKEGKVGDAIHIAGYTFKNGKSAEAWVKAIGVVDIERYCYDMYMQLSRLHTKERTSQQIVQDEANAIKGGYTSNEQAMVKASFEVRFPDSIFKKSNAAKDAESGGVVFTAPFSSADIFEGNIEISQKADMLDTLKANRDQHQNTLDTRFPPDQTNHAPTHAVLSHLLREGYFQAVGFLDSLLPFNKMMTGASLGTAAAWNKCLTYAKAVFKRVNDVRTTSTDHTSGAMLYGMLRATQLLSGYGDLGWIRHPDVSSALVVASLQKEGTAIAAVAKSAKEANDRIKTLERKNPSWNT
jgi:hypothetical protein